MACGTVFPLWMNGITPNNTKETKSVRICQVGFWGPCERSHNIRVTNCGRYFVYELIPLDICSAAYCFETDKTCILDIPTNIEVKYHNVSWTTSEEGMMKHYDPDINLACHFDRLSDKSFFYDVTWYVDNTEVLTNQTVTSNLSDIPLLSGTQMLAKGKKANSMIQCVVGAVYKAEDRPCNTKSSALFFAGIRVLTPKLEIPRGGSGEVAFQFTVPFINHHAVLMGKHHIQNALLISIDVRNGTVECDDPNKRECDTKVFAFMRTESEKYDTDAWKVHYTKKVFNRDDGDYTINRHLTLRLETGLTQGNGSKIFERLTLQDIQVFIEDTNPSWKGSYCESHTDPHMKTFDGKSYECQLDGTFVLYRNIQFQQEVQEKHHLCHRSKSYPRCSCAVAVRSGRDVFIVDICNSRTIINFPLCEDKVLNVIKKNDRYYKVILPTGTMVEIKFISWPTQNDWQLNIDIFPSPSDVGNSSGLCGILDGNTRNDFTRNDAAKTVDNPDNFHYHNPPNAFSESWRVKDNELNLFDDSMYSNLKSITEVYDRVCSCKKKTIETEPAQIECNYGTYKNCKFVVGKKFHCILNTDGQSRRKRDLHHLESIMSKSFDKNEFEFEKKRHKREAITIPKTYEEAEDICENAFQSSQSYQTCKEYVSDLSNTSLVNCISDVMITGDDNFTKIHIESALEQCSVFVVLNKTFQQTEPEVTNKIETFCQNNCSGHGICNEGNCTCEPSFAGSDCSFDLLGPPSITHISDFGFCDKSSESCEEITLFGKYFIEKMNTNCYMKRKTYAEDGITISVVDYEANVEERTMFEGFCPLEYTSEDHWVTEFTFNISNDGSRFTEIYYVYTYQSLCQEYQNYTGVVTFTFKEGYCYISNKCVPDGATNERNTCDICNTTTQKYKWSFNPDHCYIDGVCYKSGDINGTNPCSVCIPTLSTTTWSPAPELCFIDGICYLHNQTKLDSECFVCKSDLSRNEWIFTDGYCLINDKCLPDGQSNDINPCELCNISQSNSSWTHDPGHCFIDEVCYKSGDKNGTNPCSVCLPIISTSSWSPAPDRCFIDDYCYLDGESKASIECSVCQTNISRTAWTLKEGFCLISQVCFRDGQYNSTNSCQVCDVSKSNSSWENNPECISSSVSSATSTTTEFSETTSFKDYSTTKSIITDKTTNPIITNKTTNPIITDKTTNPIIITSTLQTIAEQSTEVITKEFTTNTEITVVPTTQAKPNSGITTTTPEKPTASITEPTTTNVPITTEPQTSTSTVTDKHARETTTITKLPTTLVTITKEPATEKPARETNSLLTSTSTKSSETYIPEQPTTSESIPKETTTTSTETSPKETTGVRDTTTSTEPSAPITLTVKPTTKAPEQTSLAEGTTTFTISESTPSICMSNLKDVTVGYHNVSWISIRETENRTVHEPYINLRCSFTPLPETSLHYKIMWYVDEDTFIKESLINGTDLAQSFLSMRELHPRRKTAGIKISCKVGVTLQRSTIPCKYTISIFVAGIKMHDATQTILRKGKTNITFHLTVPYVANVIEIDGRLQTPAPLEIHSIQQEATSECEDSLGVDNCILYIYPHLYNMNLKNESAKWKEPHVITVYHMDTDRYEITPSKTFKIKTLSKGNPFWNDVYFDNVTINIDDHNTIWKGKFCGSKTDPHIYTFDGVPYENHNPGEFILYRNTLFNQEIQARHTLCYPSFNFPYCTCAVSVQSGQDVFLIDVCKTRAIIDFLSRNDSVIKVYKLNDKLYKVSLPTGTYVQISLVEWPTRGAWQIDIDIYPSLSDVNNTEGLCGTLDGEKENDLTRRNGFKDDVSLVYPDDFSVSWKVQKGDNLLSKPIENRQPISSTIEQMCSCTHIGNRKCSYTTFTQCSTGKQCHYVGGSDDLGLSRNKREILEQNFAFSSDIDSSLSLLRIKRQSFTYLKSKEEAENICSSAFQNSEAYQTCMEHVSCFRNSSYSNCIRDLIMTGDENITVIHIDSAIQQCATFISLNKTLQNTNAEFTTKLQSMCPGNCSNHGICKDGNCTCNYGYGGSDCSFDAVSPPEIWSTSPSFTCDRSLQSCSRIHFQGRYFLENVENTCFINMTLLHHDGSTLSTNILEEPLSNDNLFQGSCSLPYLHNTAWVTKFTLNLSYDRKSFTTTIALYMYQSECQEYRVADGREWFLLKGDFCFINNKCVMKGLFNSNNSCEFCDPLNKEYDWTKKKECVLTPEPEESTVSSVIYILVACVLVTVLLVPLVIWRYRKSYGHKRFYRFELQGDHTKEITDEFWKKYIKKVKKQDDYIPMTQQ